ncbi:hypothetical protein [Tsukamurella soli]|uniref:Carboxypeptidase regulatory-like domain-containing protein n=1 Tax=Tsukamurella soli TaxID=644556 RepID=A0ABP8K2D7_9ACTN
MATLYDSYILPVGEQVPLGQVFLRGVGSPEYGAKTVVGSVVQSVPLVDGGFTVQIPPGEYMAQVWVTSAYIYTAAGGSFTDGYRPWLPFTIPDDGTYRLADLLPAWEGS